MLVRHSHVIRFEKFYGFEECVLSNNKELCTDLCTLVRAGVAAGKCLAMENESVGQDGRGKTHAHLATQVIP